MEASRQLETHAFLTRQDTDLPFMACHDYLIQQLSDACNKFYWRALVRCRGVQRQGMREWTATGRTFPGLEAVTRERVKFCEASMSHEVCTLKALVEMDGTCISARVSKHATPGMR